MRHNPPAYLEPLDEDGIPVIDSDEAFEDRIEAAAQQKAWEDADRQLKQEYYAKLDADFAAQEEAEYQAVVKKQVTPIGKQIIYPKDLRRRSGPKGQL